MNLPRGSALPIAALAIGCLGAFAWQRSRSTFLAIENDRAAAVAVADAHGLTVTEAMALRELLGVATPAGEWSAGAARFAALRRDLGDALAAVAVAGAPGLAAAVRRGGVDAAAAWATFRTDPRAIAGLRFLAMRDRFASRERSRN